MAGILKGQAGSPIEFEVKPTVGGDAVATEASISAPNSALVKGALNASGEAPIYACRAWVNFKGTGTVAIRASGNVSSITDNGTGDYTVNFTTAMPDANYSTSVTNSKISSANGHINIGCTSEQTTQTTSLVRILCVSSTSSASDASIVNVSVFR